MPDDGMDQGAVADRLRNQQKALAEFGLLAFRSTDLDKILRRATELVAEGLDVQLAKVLEHLPERDKFLVRAGVGWKPGVVGHEVFDGGDGSPAGYALQVDGPVISPDVASEDRFAIPEVLIEHEVASMVNVVIAGEERPFGVLEVDPPRHRDFDDDDVAFLQSYANLLAAAVDRHRAQQSLERGLREQKMLVGELQHRVKNMLGLVQSLARQTVAEDDSARAFRDAFTGRLQALARAENLAFENDPQAVDLARIVDRSIEPFRRTGALFEIDGPSVRMPARCGRIMALVVHELGTNATKHGALSADGGGVQVAWAAEAERDQRRIDFQWTERGGPAIQGAAREGFGTRLLTTLVGYELDAEAAFDPAPDGMRYRLRFTVPQQ